MGEAPTPGIRGRTAVDKGLQEPGPPAVFRACQPRIPILEHGAQIVAKLQKGMDAPFQVLQLLRSKRPHLLAWRAALVSNLEEPGQLVQGEPDRECMLDQPDTRQCFRRILAVSV